MLFMCLFNGQQNNKKTQQRLPMRVKYLKLNKEIFMKTIITGLLLIASISSVAANDPKDVCLKYEKAYTVTEIEAKGMAALAKACDAIVAGNYSYEPFLSQFSDLMDKANDATQDSLTEARNQLLDDMHELYFGDVDQLND